MIRRGLFVQCCLAAALAVRGQCEPPGVLDAQIDPEFREILLANEFLMLGGGVDVVSRAGKGEVLIGVGRVVLKPEATAVDVDKARRVADAKATAAVSRFLKSEVSTVSMLVKETTLISEKNDAERVRRTQRIEKFLSSRIQEASRLSGRIERIGHWFGEGYEDVYAAVAVEPLD